MLPKFLRNALIFKMFMEIHEPSRRRPPSKVTLESRDSEASRWILQPKALLRERSTRSLRNDDDNHINIGPGNILFTIGNNFPYCFFHEDFGMLATNYVSIAIAVWK